MKLFRLVSVLYIMLAAVCGCEHKVDTPLSQSDYDSTAFHIATLPIRECDIFYRADSMGLFDSLGVKVQIHRFGSVLDADTALDSHFVQMRAGISKAKFSVLVYSDSTMENATNLKNKIVAIPRIPRVRRVAEQAAKRQGLTPKDLNFVLINNPETRALMLRQHQYDAAVLSEPWATECEKAGAIRIYATGDSTLTLAMKQSTKKTDSDKVSLVKRAIASALNSK